MPIAIPSTESGLTDPSFGSIDHKEDPITPTHVIPVLHGTVDPEGEGEVIFDDVHQDGDDNSQTFHGKFQHKSIVLSYIQHGGETNPYYVEVNMDQSGHGDEELAYPYHTASPLADTKRSYRRQSIESPPQCYLLRCHLENCLYNFYEQAKATPMRGCVDTKIRSNGTKKKRKGKNGEPCYCEQLLKTNLKALHEAGVDFDTLLHHYMLVAKFQWQCLERDDLINSIYIIYLEGMRFGDFVGDVVDFVNHASKLSNLHYPERAGYVGSNSSGSTSTRRCIQIIHTDLSCALPWVDSATLEKISILRGKEEIRQNMELRIPLDQLPPKYGGQSAPLRQSKKTLHELIMHNNEIASGNYTCGGMKGGCRFCNFAPARAY